MPKKPRKNMTTATTQEEPRPRGRPPGTGLPEELRKSEMIRVRVTVDQKTKWDGMENAEERFRTWLDRAKP